MPSDSQSRVKNHKQFAKNYDAIFRKIPKGYVEEKYAMRFKLNNDGKVVSSRKVPAKMEVNPDYHTPKDNELVGWGCEGNDTWELRYDAKTGDYKRCNEGKLIT